MAFNSGGVETFQQDYAFVSWAAREFVTAILILRYLINYVIISVSLNGGVAGTLEYQVSTGYLYLCPIRWILMHPFQWQQKGLDEVPRVNSKRQVTGSGSPQDGSAQ